MGVQLWAEFVRVLTSSKASPSYTRHSYTAAAAAAVIATLTVTWVQLSFVSLQNNVRCTFTCTKFAVQRLGLPHRSMNIDCPSLGPCTQSYTDTHYIIYQNVKFTF